MHLVYAFFQNKTGGGDRPILARMDVRMDVIREQEEVPNCRLQNSFPRQPPK